MNLYLKKINSNVSNFEYKMYQEIPREEIGSTNEAKGLSFEEFKKFFKTNEQEEFLELNKEQTPRIVYIMYADNYPIGEIAIRTKLNDYWRKHSGNISYKIRPSERRKGYGTKMLKLAIRECKRLGLEKVLLQCNVKNLGSIRVIEKNNGNLYKETEFSNYYKIQL